MEFGTSIAIFLTIAVVLLILFCLITKQTLSLFRYFQYRMNKKAQQTGEEFSQVDQMIQNSDEDIEGQYDQFLQKRKQSQNQKLNPKKNRQQAYLFQTTQVQEPIKDSKDPIYGVSMLRKRLDGESVLPAQLSGRSVPSIKSFRPQRLQTGRSDLSSARAFPLMSNIKTPQQPLTRHQYISKLVAYKQEGIFILDVGVVSLTKSMGKIREKRVPNTVIVNPLQMGFEDQLQVLGFELKQFSCMKYKVQTQIPYMQENQEYLVSSLKMSQSKEEINFSQYYMLKDKIETSLE